MNRIFICGFYNFPRGGAASNYVQCLAKIFMAMGKEVVAITNINSEASLEQGRYQGILVEPVQIKKDKIGHYLDFNFRMGDYYRRLLQKYVPDSQDIIIAYSRDLSTLKAILRMSKHTGSKTGVCLVEWFERKKYERWLTNVQYWTSQISFYFINQKFDFILPISTYIEEYYKKKNCCMFRIPCLTDINEFGFEKKAFAIKRIFIFPGNGKMKDALTEMLQAFALLRDDEMEKIEFHICGISKFADQIIRETKLQRYLGNQIIVHDWMQYEKLVEIYRKAHFLMLARETSRTTLANFPSKIPEALSYGIIPICSRVGDYTKIYLKDKINSLILDGHDENTIVNGIRRALQMTDEEIFECSIRCRKTAEEQFDYRRWIEPMSSFLNNCVYTENISVEDRKR